MFYNIPNLQLKFSDNFITNWPFKFWNIGKFFSNNYLYKSFVIIFLLILNQGIYSQIPNLDSLSNTFVDIEDVDQTFYTELDSFKMAIDTYAKIQKPDRKLVDAMQFWAKIYDVKDPMACMKQYELSIEIAEKIVYINGIANGKHQIGLLFFNEGFYINSIEYLNQSSEILLDINEWWQYGFSLIDIGNVYFKLKQFENARKYYYKANQVFASHKFKEKYEYAVAVCYNNLGLIEMEEKTYNKALSYFKEALHWRQMLNLEEYYGHSYKYIANSYKALGKHDSAHKYYELAIKFDKAKGPKIELIKSHIGLGQLLYDIQQFEKAQIHYLEAYHISQKQEMIPMLIESANALAQFYQNINLNDSANKYYSTALDYAKIYRNMDGRQFACEKLLLIAQEQQKKDNQITYLIELLAIEKQKQVDVVLKKQLEYEVNKRFSDNEILQSSNKLQKIIIFSVLIILFLLIFLLYYFFRSRRKYIMLNNNLENKNLEIIEQKQMLEKVNIALSEYSSETYHQKEEIMAQAESLSNALTQLKELQKFKEGMAAMIVHDLKNPLNTILNQTKNIIVYESASQMLNMVNNILDLQKYEGTKMSLERKNLVLSNIIENAMYNTRYLTEQKNIGIKNHTPRGYEVNADPQLLERICINLLTNAIKYSPLNSTIKIISKPFEENFIKIDVIDNGPGISENTKNQIFEKFTQLISQNSGLTRSTGLGLAFCKMAVEAHQGKIGVEPNEGGGAIFWFTIPLSKIIETTENRTDEKLPTRVRISEENYNRLLPYLAELKQTAIYEIAEIRQITSKIKELGIPNIDAMLSLVENCGYSVNEEKYLKLIEEFEGLNKG